MSLTDRQKLFIKYYMESGKPTDSAARAGYSGKNATKAAADLLKRNKEVMKAIQDIREGKTGNPEDYTLASAMREADEAISIAKATDNAASFLAAVKLKAQLMKILDDKPVTAAFQIQISGISDGGDDRKTVVNVIHKPSLRLTGGEDEKEGEG